MLKASPCSHFRSSLRIAILQRLCNRSHDTQHESGSFRTYDQEHLKFIARNTPGFLQWLSDWRITSCFEPISTTAEQSIRTYISRKLRTRRSFQYSQRPGHSIATAPSMSITALATTRKLPHGSLKSAQCCSISPSPTPRRTSSGCQGLPPTHGIALLLATSQ
jgi:hypothetical protein